MITPLHSNNLFFVSNSSRYTGIKLKEKLGFQLNIREIKRRMNKGFVEDAESATTKSLTMQSSIMESLEYTGLYSNSSNHSDYICAFACFHFSPTAILADFFKVVMSHPITV